MDLAAALTPEEKRELVLLERERKRRRQRNQLAYYTPYPKQLEFHAAGLTDRERLLMAGNQLGKTKGMGFEVGMHLTGRYPEAGQVFYPTEAELRGIMAVTKPGTSAYDEAEAFLINLGELGLYGADCYPNGWPGKRFDRPIWAWAASVSGEATRDNPQRILLGPPAIREDWGTGAIPYRDLLLEKDKIVYSMGSGTADAVDHVLVNNVFGGQSVLQFKSYSQDREKWQGPTLDLVWFDEEPPLDIYMEGLTRTNATGGITALTFTPLLGMSTVVRLFTGDSEDLTEGNEAA